MPRELASDAALPIVFTGESIPAILSGAKTQTRRLLNPDKLRVRLPYEVKSDLPMLALEPGEKLVRAEPGIHRARIAGGGAFTVVLGKKELGIKPGEFDIVSPYLASGTTRLLDRKHWVTEAHAEQWLWVKETWAGSPGEHPSDAGVLYRATEPGWDESNSGLRWKSPLFMPRWASRLKLLVREERIERVQDISEADAKAEGVQPLTFTRKAYPSRYAAVIETRESYRDAYARRWEEINGKRKGGVSWASNPWVRAVAFKLVTP